MEVVIPVLLMAGALFVVYVLLNRSGKARKDAAIAEREGEAGNIVEVADHPRPTLASFHVRDDVAEVTYDVPLGPDGADEVMSDLLTADALEVVREKQHALPIDQVERVAVFAGRNGDPQKVGTIDLPERGQLPPPMVAAPQLHLANVGFDPIAAQFESSGDVPSTVSRSGSDELGPIAEELRIPKAVDLGLRAQGIDPESMNAGDLVQGLLKLFGYSITSTGSTGEYVASKAGKTTFVRNIDHAEGGYPEVDEADMKAFLFEFITQKADNGLLVSDKFAPFGAYQMESSEPRIKFVTRERLQTFVDSLALS